MVTQDWCNDQVIDRVHKTVTREWFDGYKTKLLVIKTETWRDE